MSKMLLNKVQVWALVLALSLAITVPVIAAAPPEGVVVEGQSVPGVTLGDSRAQVEVAYGHPDSCQNMGYYDGRQGLNGICEFVVDGGGRVTVYYFAPDGGPAQDSADDLASTIRWQQAVNAWVTTAGVNTTLALDDPQAVVNAYPEAEVTYNMFGSIYQVRDPEVGIEVTWNHDFYGGFTTVSMSIFSPYMPPPLPDMIHVTEIVMTADRRSVIANVLIFDDQDQPVEGVVVTATWTYPKVENLQVSAATASDGFATFRVDKAQRGVYYLNINDVSLDGYVYDYINSTTLGVISKAK